VSEWRILHISDLHIEDPAAQGELLRKGFYKEYLGSLAHVIGLSAEGPIDCMVVTGDFVQKSHTEHLGFAGEVISFLAEAVRLAPSQVATCIGQHDVVRTIESQGKAREARAPYEAFLAQLGFANSASVVAQAPRFVLCKPRDTIWCLMIDSTLGGPPGDPGDIPSQEIDSILEHVYVERIPVDHLLIVGTHFPPMLPPDLVADFLENDPDYHKNHEWVRGKPLRERIARYRERVGAKMLWLSGDVHQPLQQTIGKGQYFVTAGRLGTSTAGADSPVFRQARVITVSSTSEAPLITTWSYMARGRHESEHLGEWVPLTDNAWGAKGDKSYARAPSKTSAASDGAVPIALRPGMQIAVIDVELQDHIVEQIRQRGLYAIGRFRTTQSEVSLAWVSIGPLLNATGMLNAVVERMTKWVEQHVANMDMEMKDVVLLGIDCWGSILASQVSVLTGAANYCIAARGRGEFSTAGEGISQRVVDTIAQVKCVILVNDVIATGNTIRWVYDQVVEKLPERHLEWLTLSVICDPAQDRSVDCRFTSCHGTACALLRMPVLLKEEVPDESVFPPRLSFA
jgi:pyrimidine operon attenuation protein/uracil phosphoribosyltransferase